MTYYASGNVKLSRARPAEQQYIEFQGKQVRGPLVLNDDDGEQLRAAVNQLRDMAHVTIWRKDA